MKILIVNVGSTSLKYTLYDDGTERVRGTVERIGLPDTHFVHSAGDEVVEETGDRVGYRDAIRRMLELLAESVGLTDLSSLDAIGFKVVHGGRYTGTVELTPDVLEEMERYRFVAPGHNPPYVDAIRLFAEVAPSVRLVGSFETGFHRTIPDWASTYGVPFEWRERYGVRRYGFHGASHSYIARRSSELLADARRVVSCHLGGSSSLCAVVDGASVDVSMGFSPQGGPPQSTRAGDLDAFVALHLVTAGIHGAEELVRILTKDAGLKGISGLSGDMRDIEDAAAEGDDRARLALEVFAYDVRKLIGAYAAAMGGLDAVVFTGGIGENGADVRSSVLDGLAFLGIELDHAANEETRGREGRISTGASPVEVWVIPTNEEKMVVEQVAEFIRSA